MSYFAYSDSTNSTIGDLYYGQDVGTGSTIFNPFYYLSGAMQGQTGQPVYVPVPVVQNLVVQDYAPAPKNFNRYINASDMLEEFIKFAAVEGVRKSEIMGLPVDLFIKWLIIRACEEDQEEPNVVLELPAPKKYRCLGCGKFMRKETVLVAAFHGALCASLYYRRIESGSAQSSPRHTHSRAR